jgi:2-polyprenyl-3-methyl-5-hydroxy-6-metoxy-1,4-benzoquinol methylase
MTQHFDREYWESRWQRSAGHGTEGEAVPNPYLTREISDLTPGTALDAGCGGGAEAIWLATVGWQVTAVDISTEALARASQSARQEGVPPDCVLWVTGDLTAWEPDQQFDLVTTHYTHTAMPQLAFYERISHWVAPGGTLLIVGHLRTRNTMGHDHGRVHHQPEEATVTAASITGRLDSTQWDIVNTVEQNRTKTNRAGQEVQLHDVVVRAARRP